MRIIIFGPPGAGKGTQAAKLSSYFKIPHISTGEIFRQMAESGDQLGIEARDKYWAKGYYVPDQVTNKLVEKRIQLPDCKKGFILDGYPRTLDQAKELDAIAKRHKFSIDAVLNLQVRYESLVARLNNRSRCAKCGSTYGLGHLPKKKGRCDKEGGELEQRLDDTPEKVKERLRIYQQHTLPLLEYYKKLRKDLNGEPLPNDVHSELVKILENGKAHSAKPRKKSTRKLK